MSKLHHVKMRQILKRLNLNKYYEHIHHIINKLNGLITILYQIANQY